MLPTDLASLSATPRLPPLGAADIPATWSKRDLTGKNFVYIWVDGVHFGARLEDASQCILVVIGATAEGKKELLAMSDGYRESEQSWKSCCWI